MVISLSLEELASSSSSLSSSPEPSAASSSSEAYKEGEGDGDAAKPPMQACHRMILIGQKCIDPL